MQSPPEISNPNGEQDKNLFSVVANSLRRTWGSHGFLGITIHLYLLLKSLVSSRFFLISLACGGGLGVLLALGQSYAIGLSAAWKIYGRWWILSPLFGPLLLGLFLLLISIVELVESLHRRWMSFMFGSLIVIGLAAVLMFAGYQGAREDNPLLSSQPADLEAISESVGEQSRILGGLSATGVKLLNQLKATESELETAKKQLTVTLANFDAQRHAAQQVTEELSQLGDRQKQIALQTEELERILGGQQPITRHDLQRANVQGLVSGVLIGFVTSLLASMAYNALRKRKPPSAE
jgi:hypothetical protein